MAPLAGKPVLAHTLAIFAGLAAVSEIVIAITAEDAERCRTEIVEKFGFDKVTAVVPGGERRADSVKNALAAAAPGAEAIAIHDGARPLFPAELLDEGLAEVRKEGIDGVVFGVPVTDTIKEADNDGIITGTLRRSRLWSAQTPQIFTLPALAKAYNQPAAVLASATDDAQLVEQAGGRVKVIMGSAQNIKLTTPVDMVLAEEIIKRRVSGL